MSTTYSADAQQVNVQLSLKLSRFIETKANAKLSVWYDGISFRSVITWWEVDREWRIAGDGAADPTYTIRNLVTELERQGLLSQHWLSGLTDCDLREQLVLSTRAGHQGEVDEITAEMNRRREVK